MPLGPLEGWLATKEELLKSWVAKAVAALGTVLLASLSAWLADTPAMRILVPLIVVLLASFLWLLSHLCVYRNIVSLLEAELSSLRAAKKEEGLSEDAYSILCMAYDAYPERLELSEFRDRLSLSAIDVEMALLKLVEKGFLSEPEDSLWRAGESNPDGYGLIESGAIYVKERRKIKPT